jgi:ABC-2 type transport system permease protein
MDTRRLRLVFRQDLRANSGRLLIWILVLVLALTAWGLSSGNMRISSGNSAVGGTKAWITSEFANAKMIPMVVFLFYSFFLAIASGMAVMQDEEMRVGEILHATPLKPSEYLWGKFLAILATFLGVLGLHLLFSIFFNHVVPNPKAVEVRGPFSLINYLRPAIMLGLPSMIFIAGTTFAIGEKTRKPILVFMIPMAAILFSAFFLWSWTPSWLTPGVNRLLMLIDPAGVRWMSETWLKVDRGVDFYNKAPVTYEFGFMLSRIAYALIGLACVAFSVRSFERTLRGTRSTPARRAKPGAASATVPATTSATVATAAGTTAALTAASRVESLSHLGMTARPPGLLAGIGTIVRFELRELLSQPGLYLFAPIILLQTFGTCLVALGAFDTPVLITSGGIAVRAFNTLTLLICLLSLFYAVESLRRERNTKIASIYYATPARTASILFGKAIANCAVGVIIVFATFLGGAIALLVQHRTPIELGPFFVTWGLLLLPTFLLWNAFVMFLFSLTNNRFTTYGIGLAILALTGYLQMTGKMTWPGNWDFWNVLQWSDMGRFEIDRTAIWLNRLAAVSLSIFFVALTVRLFPRHDRDATRTVHRLGGGSIARGALRMLPYAAVPVVLIVALHMQVLGGFQGKAIEKKRKDYWKQNLATWKDAPLPAIKRVDVDMELDPARHSFRMDGAYSFVNEKEKPLAQIALTGLDSWDDMSWTMNGAEAKPEDRTRLYVFTPLHPLAAGDTLRIGFRYRGVLPKGITKNGGGMPEFILPSGIVLTTFRPTFLPVLGYMEEIGVDDKNRYEPKVYPDDFYQGITKPAFGSGRPYRTHVRLTAPAAYTLNSVGTKTSETVDGGKRTVVWDSDEPVRFFNVVGGRWAERKGDGVAVYYHSKHAYNVEEMTGALEAARRYYGEWFLPYPWKELKLSEFPALAFYAQGFPTDITFSEGIGFLTKSDPKTNTAFLVAAHESAHQWWGNILTPGEGPGGNILSEGMAHFSTVLLMNQVKGERARIEFCKRIEEHYGDERQMDSERPLVKIDGSRDGDETVTYNKGGWVFWMLLNRMGREANLAGLQAFIRQYKDGPDYPVLQDFVAAMRRFAPDSTAYDDFTRQWFYEVVVPEYRLTEAKKSADPAGGWSVSAQVANIGTGRMPVEIAAIKGERFTKDGAGSPDYREARTSLVLGAGEIGAVTLHCDFEPEKLVTDPDARVLQLRRKAAETGF